MDLIGIGPTVGGVWCYGDTLVRSKASPYNNYSLLPLFFDVVARSCKLQPINNQPSTCTLCSMPDTDKIKILRIPSPSSAMTETVSA